MTCAGYNKFVTCNYTGLHGTRFGGRLNKDDIFKYSLRAIAECGDPIWSLSSRREQVYMNAYLESQGVNNISNIDFSLIGLPFFPQVDLIKDKKPEYYTSGSWLSRSVEIMWGKFHWLESQLNTCYENDNDYMFWIDASLSSGAIIPRKYNPFHGNEQYYEVVRSKWDLSFEYSHRHDIIYNKEFSKRLEQYTGDKILLICNVHKSHSDQLGFDFENKMDLWPIGGLFGGKKKLLKPFIDEFKRVSEKVMSNGYLATEETLMAVILNEHPDWFKLWSFNTWYHDDWFAYGCWNPTMNSFCNFFDRELGITPRSDVRFDCVKMENY
jgi:hypothetical protein